MCASAPPDRVTILLADDDALFRDAAAMILRDSGYDVFTANDARAGAELVRERRFAAIVADIQMAGNRRLQWLHDLARNAPGVPVMVITGHPSLRTAMSSVRLPVVAYLVKPVSAEDLLAEVARALLLPKPSALVDEPIAAQLRSNLLRARERWKLTPRQADTLERLAQGDSNKEIATALGCAQRTVELHVSALLERSGRPSRAALIACFWSER
jgi:DNA-binding NarL/FixJ family response regulator